MTAPNKPQRRFAVRFDMEIGGLVGLAVVSLCIFLWLFLLGVWAGQTVLSPTSSDSAPMLHQFSTELMPPAGQGAPPDEEEGPESAAGPVVQGNLAVKEEARTDEKSFFALQVGAYREKTNAAASAAEWQAKGYEVFSLAPREGSNLTRVFVGRFDDLVAANRMVAEIEEKEKLRAYITLIPAEEK